MANADFPWFKFYARDWLTDSNVMLMPCLARGAYIHLLAFQWENGGIPDAPADVARLVGLNSEVFAAEVWPYLEAVFQEGKRPLSDPSEALPRINARLEKERSEKRAEREQQVESGRRGGLKSRPRKELTEVSDPSLQRKRPLSDPQASSDADADEDPLTPKHGGSEIPAGAPGSRADGTNPRAVRAAEEDDARRVEEQRRTALIHKIDPGGTIGGTYRGDRGFRLWNTLRTAELEAFAALAVDVGNPVPSEISKIAAAARAHREARDAEEKRNGGTENGTVRNGGTENGTVLIEAIPETNAQIRVIRGKA